MWSSRPAVKCNLHVTVLHKRHGIAKSKMPRKNDLFYWKHAIFLLRQNNYKTYVPSVMPELKDRH
jgi:hypothetical protein